MTSYERLEREPGLDLEMSITTLLDADATTPSSTPLKEELSPPCQEVRGELGRKCRPHHGAQGGTEPSI
jgi:hypothetical protein